VAENSGGPGADLRSPTVISSGIVEIWKNILS
jgi:hypothetical protein